MGCECCKSIVQNIEIVCFFQFYKKMRRTLTEIMTPFPKSRYYLIAVLWERCRKYLGRRLDIANLRSI